MDHTIYLGFTCEKCWTRVPVYTFTNLAGKIAATPPEDQNVECPTCHFPRTIRFSFLPYLERWQGPAEVLPPKPVETTTAAGSGANVYREFARMISRPGVPLDYRRAQLLNGTDGCVYIVSPDGTTVIFRDDSARQLREKFSAQSANAGEWDFRVRLNIEIAAPVSR